MIAWLMKTPFAIRQIERLSYDYIKMDCAGDKCYGVLAVSARSQADFFHSRFVGPPHLFRALSFPCHPRSVLDRRQGHQG